MKTNDYDKKEKEHERLQREKEYERLEREKEYERLEREKEYERQERQQEKEYERQEKERAYELEKLRIEATNRMIINDPDMNENNEDAPRKQQDLHKIIPKFESKVGDIGLCCIYLCFRINI